MMTHPPRRLAPALAALTLAAALSAATAARDFAVAPRPTRALLNSAAAAAAELSATDPSAALALPVGPRVCPSPRGGARAEA